MTRDELERVADEARAAWDLANECLTILPRDDLPLTGLALTDLVAVWLNAIPAERRASTYMSWLNMLHKNFVANGVLSVRAIDNDGTVVVGEPDDSHAVH